MMSMQDMFYGESEPVWIVKPEKDDKKKAGDAGSTKKEADDTILASIPYYPYYYPDYVPAPVKKEAAKEGDKKETKVVMKVPICCGECVESIEVALFEMGGVKSVDGSVWNQKVTVVVTKAAPVDILLECRKLFKKSKMWSDDD